MRGSYSIFFNSPGARKSQELFQTKFCTDAIPPLHASRLGANDSMAAANLSQHGRRSREE
jgi:hypothetical protein